MNPWLLELVAAARREEFLRAARHHPSTADQSARSPRPVRNAAGSLLIRAGHRLAGPEVQPRPVFTGRPAI
ncbi:MAG TPA: hypothetical protein VG435_02935 [Acidimicrobiales bacterium]|nr:hypothetical protein [Acidimicrobiales bacterium]